MRLIDATELMEHVYRDELDSRELIAQMINNAPTVRTMIVRHGKWLRQKFSEYLTAYHCSQCGNFITGMYKPDYNFCPYCGARMDLKEGD